MIFLVLGMDIPSMISECSTLAQLKELEEKFPLNELEKNMVFNRRLNILVRLLDWSIENEALGLEGSMSDSWTPEERQAFIEDWMNDEPLIQSGFGEKRGYDEMSDDNAGTSREVRNDNYFAVKHSKQVRIQKFTTTGLDYTIQFTNALANLELLEHHNRLHEIFQSLLETVTKDVPMDVP